MYARGYRSADLDAGYSILLDSQKVVEMSMLGKSTFLIFQ